MPAARCAAPSVCPATTSGGALSYQWKFDGSNVGTNKPRAESLFLVDLATAQKRPLALTAHDARAFGQK